jgi:hypothetical protein
MSFDDESGQFNRLHSIFTFHLGVAVGLSWLTSLYASLYAPWVRNIRPLIDPSDAGQVESTWSFLFIFPVVLTVAWLMTIFGQNVLRQLQIMRNQTVEFAVAGAVAFVVFYLSIDRAVAAMLIGQ